MHHREKLTALPRNSAGSMRSSRSTLIAAFIAIVAALIAFQSPTMANDVADEVDQRISALGIEPGPVDAVIEMALQTRRAIVAGDFEAANEFVLQITDASEVQDWRFHPFEDFFGYVVDNAPPEFKKRLDEWVAADQTNAAPVLFRAKFMYDLGWTARGHGFASSVSADQQAEFSEYILAAYDDVNAAVDLSQSNPFGFLLRLQILRTGGVSDAFFAAFNDAIGRHPDYYPLYEMALSALQPRWGGSIENMTSFVEEFAGGSDQHSPLKLLYLSLYRHMLATAEIGCRNREGDDVSRCIRQLMDEMHAGGLEGKIADALKLFDHRDRFQFGLAVKAIMSPMMNTPGGEGHAGKMLQLVATAMQSDTRLAQAAPGRNYYVVDELVAQSWDTQGHAENAITKYTEALTSIQRASFPSEAERRFATAGIYRALANVAGSQSETVDQIVFQKAAILLGVPWDAYRICRSYFRLDDYDQAIAACTDAIDATGDSAALYWRGEAYQASGQPDLALRDLTEVADGQGYYTPYAAVTMSMIYFGRDDLSGALAVLNAYPSLYDADHTDHAQVAVGYNNRCYAYMELGELEKALDDCRQSLEYGSIPDAFRKEQELVALLKAKP